MSLKILNKDSIRLFFLKRILKKINKLSSIMENMTEKELASQTQKFRNRIKAGETLWDILPEAYATVREVSFRVLGKRPYDVQILGAIVLYQGKIAEMKTGEGKTLTATMPMYLNSLSGQTSFLITTNSYLAIRDAEEMRAIYEFLGLTVGIGVSERFMGSYSLNEKKKMYESDIIYTTNSSLGFDYLLDNLATKQSDKIVPKFHYAIIDEIDSVLLDFAQMPLIISGFPRVQSNLYKITNDFILSLRKDVDFYFNKDEKEVWLTTKGIKVAEEYFSIKHLFTKDNLELIRHINLALKAHHIFEKDKDYVVVNEKNISKIKLIDKKNARILEGTKLRGGIHQAIEMKSEVDITDEQRSMASITYQNLFLMFSKISGMTGTAKSSEEEFIEVYGLEVISIPTHRPIQRKDYPDKIYKTSVEKINQSISFIKNIYARKQPLLIVTNSVKKSNLYSQLLLSEEIPHSVLNAFNVAKEADIIKEAGRIGTVTIATNMAGRGTDIKLDKEARKIGGLAIVGVDCMENYRATMQLRGRAGRQGDPGFSQFFISLEDDIVKEHSPYWFKKINKEKNFSNRLMRKIINQTQKSSDSQAQQQRKITLEFAKSMKIQRELIYKTRDSIIEQGSDFIDIEGIFDNIIYNFSEKSNLTKQKINRFIFDNISYEQKDTFQNNLDKTTVYKHLHKIVRENIDNKKKMGKEVFTDFERVTLLKAIDEVWVEEVDFLQQLRTSVDFRQTAQRNSLFEYHRESYESFVRMKHKINQLIFRYYLLSEIVYNEEGEIEINYI